MRVIRRAGRTVAVLAAAALAGCGSDDEGGVKPPPGTTYPEPTTPQHVLEALTRWTEIGSSL